MDQYEFIRVANRVYGKGIREIAREFGHHRKTVRKAIAGMKPEYRMKKARKSPVMDAVREVVDEWLRKDQITPKKQRHTAKRIYDRLKEEYPFKGSESTVRRFVRERKTELQMETQEAMVPLCANQAGEAEVDWGEAVVEIGKEVRKVKVFVMRPRYSGKPFARAYLNESQEMFFDAHTHAFAYYGGVYPTLIYDNLKTAVLKVMKGKKRKEQPSFQAFRAHYTFEARFCNPAKGNEKGGVEGQIKSLRKNLMVPIPRVANLEELNEQLLEGCDRWSERILGGREERKTIKERFGEERGCLLALPKAPFEAAHVTTARVNKYQTVQIKKVRYSVPTEYVGRNVDVRVTCERVEIGWGGKKIAQHSRSFRAGQWQLEPQHYLGLIKRKVGAFERARVIQDWREKWPESHEKLLQNWRQRHGEGSGNREFLEVLTLYGAYPASEVEKAVELAAGCGLGDSKSVRSLLQSRQEEEADREGLAEERLPEFCRERHEAPNLAKYDALVVKG